MRRILIKYLADVMGKRLAEVFPMTRPLDPKREQFNGTFGYVVAKGRNRTFFLVVTTHEERDAFRVALAWSPSDAYPARPYCDLTANAEQLLRRDCVEVQLGQLLDGAVPFEYHADAVARESELAREAIAERLRHGDEVAPHEWVATLSSHRGPISDCQLHIDRACVEIVSALRSWLMSVGTDDPSLPKETLER